MLFDVPDPVYTSSVEAKARFWLAIRISLGFVALLWIIECVNLWLDLGLERFGVRPRELAGLPGILLAPLLHHGFDHLISNALPLVVLGTGMLYLYPTSALKVIPSAWLGPGIAVWLFAAGGSVHAGASGLVYGLVSYVFLAGVLRRDRRAIAASLLVCFLYGSMVWGVLPIKAGVSWQTHLAAALIGLALAIVLRRLDIPPLKRFAWEDEERSPDPQNPDAS
jgi:membrane associated rhomboid family serine protease